MNNEETLLFESITEIGIITLPQGAMFVLKSLDPELTRIALEDYRTKKEPFKNVILYDFSNPSLFANHFKTFTNKTNFNTVFKLDNFFVFSENESVSQHIISSYLNNNNLSETSHYKKVMSQLNDEFSLQITKLNGNYRESFSRLLKTEIKKTKTNIVLPPQHIRMSSKDYILIAEKSGKLNILNRVRNPRITVSKKFEFSKIHIAKEVTNFVVTTKNNTKHSISQAGKVSSKKLDVSNSYWFTINGKTKATLDDNILRINGKLVELPFGIYTQPQIFNVNRKYYITITETQENKLYIFTKFGELLPNFPVYGTSLAQLNNKKLHVLISSGPKSFVIYEVQ